MDLVILPGKWETEGWGSDLPDNVFKTLKALEGEEYEWKL